jgi:hypothetical protein
LFELCAGCDRAKGPLVHCHEVRSHALLMFDSSIVSSQSEADSRDGLPHFGTRSQWSIHRGLAEP